MKMTVERPFSLSGGLGSVTIQVEPGRVRLPAALCNLHWHDADRLSVHLKELAMTARVLEDLKRAQVVDVRLLCTKCGEKFREGVVTVEDVTHSDPTRLRHAQGSPECGR